MTHSPHECSPFHSKSKINWKNKTILLNREAMLKAIDLLCGMASGWVI